MFRTTAYVIAELDNALPGPRLGWVCQNLANHPSGSIPGCRTDMPRYVNQSLATAKGVLT